MKTLVLIAALLAVYIIVKQLLRRPEAGPEEQAEMKTMVRCDHCGLFVPQGQAIDDGMGHHFCCIEHKDAHRSS